MNTPTNYELGEQLGKTFVRESTNIMQDQIALKIKRTSVESLVAGSVPLLDELARVSTGANDITHVDVFGDLPDISLANDEQFVDGFINGVKTANVQAFP